MGRHSRITETHEVEIRAAFRGNPAEVKTMTIAEHVCWLIENFGVGIETAAAVVGVSDRTIFNWQARGQEWADKLDGEDQVEAPEAELPYLRFLQGLKKARGEAEIFHLKNIKAHAFGNWQASAWYLERVRPERYARRSRHEVTGPEGGPVRHEVFVPPSEEWEEKVTQIVAEAEIAKQKASQNGN